METLWDLFGIGTAAVDDLLFVDHFPIPDSKMPIREIQRHGGGQTATALVAASRHGARAAFCACLDDDDLSKFTLQTLSAEGVDCSAVFHTPGSGPVHSIVIIEPSKGTRTILYNNSKMREPQTEEINPDWIIKSRVFFFDQNTPRAGLYAARLAKNRGIPVIADLEKLALPEMDTILSNIDHLIISQAFAEQLTGETAVSRMMSKLSASTR